MNNLKINLNLKALTNVFELDVKGKTGVKRCACIPIGDNDIFVSQKGGIYISFIAWENSKLKDGKTHLVKQSFSKGVREKMNPEDLKNAPIIGDVKPLEQQKKVEKVEEPELISQDDDLPF
jgi:hypothetical protein